MLRASVKSGHKRPVVAMPTGSGKTVLAAHLVTRARGNDKRLAFVVPALSLIDQTYERFAENGLPAADLAVMQADHPYTNPSAPIQICSVQTLASRGWPVVDIAVIDECHVVFEVTRRWQADDPSRLFIGLSATPWQKGMAEDWDDLIQPTSIRELIDEGMLCPFKAFAPSHPDLSQVHTIAGDYHEGELAEVMSKPKLVGDVVQTWIDKAANSRSLVFCVNRAHARQVEEEFAGQNIPVAYVDALTPREERARIIRALDADQIKLIVSIGTMTTGVDIPSVTCIVYARPTKSEILYVQSIGRGLRTYPGKTHLLILDHSDTTLRLGTVDMIRHEALLSGVKGASQSQKEDALPLPKECPQCQMVVPAAESVCPNCGFELRRKSDVRNAPGLLRELDGEEIVASSSRFGRPSGDWTLQDKIDFYGEMIFYGHLKGYKPGWAAVQYKERLKEWPNDPWIRNARPVPPTRDALGWIKSRQIAWFKAHAAERRRFRDG